MTVRQMQLAKHVIDVGLSTNNLEPMLRFWQQDVGLRFDYVLPVRRGQDQYRHEAQGSVIKLNHHAEPLPTAAPSGYRELVVARDGVQKPRPMVDPDGNRVRLVPPGHDDITQIAVTMGVRSLSEHCRFYGDILGFAVTDEQRRIAKRPCCDTSPAPKMELADMAKKKKLGHGLINAQPATA